jgi:amino acid adenylation domain-containing protein
MELAEQTIAAFTKTLDCRFDPSIIQKLQALSAAESVTFEGVLLSALRTLLERYKGIDAGIGLPEDLSFRHVLRTSGTAFDQLPSVSVERAGKESASSSAEFCLVISETAAGGIDGHWIYRGSSMNNRRLLRFSEHFQTMLAAVLEDPDKSVWHVPLIGHDEYREIEWWNQTSTEYPRHALAHELFEEQAAASPDSPAVIFGEEFLTYKELNERSNQLAHHLQQRGVISESVVGIALDRSIAMVVSMLAVLKTGACYLPLDASYPQDRLRFMVEDSGAKILLTDKAGCGAFHGVLLDVIDLDAEQDAINSESADNLVHAGTSDALSYVMYTSGSVGVPKGVEVLHRGIVRLVKNTNYIQLDSSDVIAQVSKFSFDAITFEVWGALLNGGRLVILPYETILSPSRFAEALRHSKITSMFLTAALFNIVAKRKPDAFAHMRNLLVGGDVVSPESARIVLATAPPERLVNGYGPTECTTFSCCHHIDQVPESGSIPIGHPIANSETYLLDRFLQPVPVGVIGEIYLGGDGLARGYRNRAELTAQRFVPHPFKKDDLQRLYKTGDKGRYREDGSVEFFGRTDHQIKLRGHRIEPGEIEAVLRKHPEVADCVVVLATRPYGEQCLIAYADKRPHCDPDEDQLKDFLARRLPGYMIPTHIAVLDTFPLTPEGKINRKALPPYSPPKLASAELPSSELESKISEVWKSILGRPVVSLDDNFFDLGGTSLLLAAVENELHTRLNITIAITDLFRFPTIRKLAAYLSDRAGDNSALASARERAERRKNVLQSLRKQPAAS